MKTALIVIRLRLDDDVTDAKLAAAAERFDTGDAGIVVETIDVQDDEGNPV